MRRQLTCPLAASGLALSLLLPSPLFAAPKKKCAPSYPTLCIPVGIDDLDCSDVWRLYKARNFKVLRPDPHRFDRDKDGIGCEKGGR